MTDDRVSRRAAQLKADAARDLTALSRELSAKGKLVEAGWLGFRLAVVHPDASPAQLGDMRGAFFAGAHHLYSSIMAILDPGTEPTPGDLERMAKIAAELDAFGAQLEGAIRTEWSA